MKICGIAGFIGKSKNEIVTYQLITNIFEKLEIRGIDASGFWGVTEFGDVMYHKEPIRSSDLIKKEIWKDISKYNPTSLLMHARSASKGCGEPYNNKNNHPFTNYDKSIGLIHNGRIDVVEQHELKQKYITNSECDSEILLRIFESKQNLSAICDIFSFINKGHMAVAIGERTENGNLLWLFRNEHRPLWIIDLRETLGQIFFVSEPSIWEYASSNLKISNQKLIELPNDQIWLFQFLNTITIQKYKVNKENFKKWKFDGEKSFSFEKKSNFKIITNLDDNDKIKCENRLIGICDEMIDTIRDIYDLNIDDKALEKLEETNYQLLEIKKQCKYRSSI